VGLQGRAVGLDLNKDRIKVAQERYGDSSNLKFVVGTNDDVEKYGPFDRVFCSFVIYWIRDQTKCFKQIFNALKPGGLFGLVAVTEAPPFLHKLTKVMAGPDVHLNELMNWHYRTLDGWNALGEETGFNVKHSDQYSAYNSHSTLGHLLLWWEATTSGQCMSHLENGDEGLDQLLREFNLDKDQPIEFKETVIRTVLQKPC
jgi:SAM-dependent methyltransferase